MHNRNSKLHLLLSITALIFITSCEKDISISSPIAPVPQAFLYIGSVPEGSLIYLNERNTGRFTPDSISFIDEGAYRVTLKRKYFRDTSFVIQAVEGELKSINIDYLSNPLMYGGFTFNSQPEGAQIFINDSSINAVTPFTISNLLPGHYKITMRKDNFRESIIPSFIESNKLTNVFTVLKDTALWVDFQVFNSGIQSNNLTSIAIDGNGVKWIGTGDKGLIRFDEENFFNYNKNNSGIPSNTINNVETDHQNRIWISTNEGIGVFDGTSWVVYNNLNSELTTNNINVVKFDKNGMAWIGTQSNLLKYDGGNWTLYNYSSPQVDFLWVNDIAFDDENNLWLGTSGNGIVKFNGADNFIVYKRPANNLLTNAVSSAGIERNGIKWFLNDSMTEKIGETLVFYRGGLTYLQADSFYTNPIGQNTIVTENIFIDSNNKKWISTNEGIYIVTGTTGFSYLNRSNSGLTSNNITEVIKDVNNIIWVATIGGGLIKYKGEM